MRTDFIPRNTREWCRDVVIDLGQDGEASDGQCLTIIENRIRSLDVEKRNTEGTGEWFVKDEELQDLLLIARNIRARNIQPAPLPEGSQYLNDEQEQAVKGVANWLAGASSNLDNLVDPIGWTHSDYPKRNCIRILENAIEKAQEALALLKEG